MDRLASRFSKGVMVYTHISVPDCVVRWRVPSRTFEAGPDRNFQPEDLEVQSVDLHSAVKGGRLQWTVIYRGEEIATEYNDISPLTGELLRGTMRTIGDTETIVNEQYNLLICYGFYDAGPGAFGLPSKDHCYVTVAPNHSTWIGDLAPPSSPQASRPFSKLVLSAPHDPGMNQMQIINLILSQLDHETDMGWLLELYPYLKEFAHLDPLFGKVFWHHLPNIVYTLAFTQKDSITQMLATGARYFEFRPAHMIPYFRKLSALADVLYFQHAFFPGLAYDVFLTQIVEFLDKHPTEIVVIHIRWDGVTGPREGITDGCKKPTEQELQEYMDAALGKAVNAKIVCGNADDFSRSIDELRSSGTRLICLVEAEKYDSYDGKAYATITAAPILSRFEAMNTESQADTHLTILQCQATSQAIPQVVAYSVIDANTSTSCLMSTKGMLDVATLGWIRDNALQRLQADKLLVVLNDFIDGMTTDTTIELSRRRLNGES